jgi:hypothetical protein
MTCDKSLNKLCVRCERCGRWNCAKPKDYKPPVDTGKDFKIIGKLGK